MNFKIFDPVDPKNTMLRLVYMDGRVTLAAVDQDGIPLPDSLILFITDDGHLRLISGCFAPGIVTDKERLGAIQIDPTTIKTPFNRAGIQ